ncbi:MAG TPA: AAA family ATPase, partial [Oscillatoriaceae cyanobacterium]
MVHLCAVSKKPDFPDRNDYPFGVPIIRALEELTFRAPVTFLVGENGSGKSTLLEAIAVAADLPAIGQEDLRRDPTLAPARELAGALRL